MQHNTNKLIWLDMEMTGLDRETDVPLEVAVILTNENLEELDVFEASIWQPESIIEKMTPFVRKMHTMNGIIDKTRNSSLSLKDVEKELYRFISNWISFEEGILCGSSIHTDRAFLKNHFSLIDKYLHYRMVDVSSVRELVSRWYNSPTLATPSGDHTALNDIRASISELQIYRKLYFK